MAKLTEAEMIARYDAERTGTLYIKPEPGAEQRAAGERDGRVLGAALIADDDQMIADWIDTHLPTAADELTDDARRAIDLDFDNVVDAVADLPDHQRRAAIAMWEGLLVGLAIA